MEMYTAGELKAIIEKHGMWLRDEDGGERANLTGANLTMANLTWADLTGAKGFIYISQRSDGYQFFATYRDDKWMIQAGCRLFTPAEYRLHTKTYSCDKKRAETLLLIDFAEAMIAQRGIV